METTAQTEAGSASNVSISQFPDATQPDIVRAAIKDGYYRKLLNRDTQEVLLQIMGNFLFAIKNWFMITLSDVCLGPRWITDNSQELKLFSNICYYGLTTLIGKKLLKILCIWLTILGAQTLGEEYCDIVQVTNTPNLCPSTNQRLFLLSCGTIPSFTFSYLCEIKLNRILYSRPRTLCI